MQARQLNAVVRASIYSCTPADEIEQLVQTVKLIGGQKR